MRAWRIALVAAALGVSSLVALLAVTGCGGGGAAVNPNQVTGYSRAVTQSDITTSGRGAITGVVTNAAGSPQPNASVALVGTGTSSVGTAAVLASTRTNAHGQYGFANVPPGHQTLRVVGQSDKPVQVQAGHVVRASFGKAAGSDDVQDPGEEPATVASVRVTPEEESVAIGGTLQFEATAYDANDEPIEGVAFTWTSSDEAIATVDENGLASGVALGDVFIKAKVAAAESARVRTQGGGQVADDEGQAVLHVIQGEAPGPVASICVQPEEETTEVGGTVQFTAKAYDAEEREVQGVAFTWCSSCEEVATVDDAGLATGVGAGDATIKARLAETQPAAVRTQCEDGEEIQGTAVLHVTGGDTPGPVTTVVIAPEEETTEVGGTVQFTATAYDAEEREVPDATIVWFSADEGIATVTDGGLATGVANGDATITARVNLVAGAEVRPACHVQAEAVLHVTGGEEPPAPASVVLEPPEETVAVGGTLQYTATAYDGEGNPLPDTEFVWGSSNEEIATVTQDGLATGVAVGDAEITARVAGVEGAGVKPQCHYIQDSAVLHVEASG